MEFNLENKFVKLSAKGMELEGKGQNGKASEKFKWVWSLSQNDFEKIYFGQYVDPCNALTSFGFISSLHK